MPLYPMDKVFRKTLFRQNYPSLSSWRTICLLTKTSYALQLLGFDEYVVHNSNERTYTAATGWTTGLKYKLDAAGIPNCSLALLASYLLVATTKLQRNDRFPTGNQYVQVYRSAVLAPLLYINSGI
jgi:hypothetical protein